MDSTYPRIVVVVVVVVAVVAAAPTTAGIGVMRSRIILVERAGNRRREALGSVPGHVLQDKLRAEVVE